MRNRTKRKITKKVLKVADRILAGLVIGPVVGAIMAIPDTLKNGVWNSLQGGNYSGAFWLFVLTPISPIYGIFRGYQRGLFRGTIAVVAYLPGDMLRRYQPILGDIGDEEMLNQAQNDRALARAEMCDCHSCDEAAPQYPQFSKMAAGFFFPKANDAAPAPGAEEDEHNLLVP